MKRKNLKVILTKEVEEVKHTLVQKEARDLASEFNELFKDDLKNAEYKFIRLVSALDVKQMEYLSLNRNDIYEVLLDNEINDIVSYINECIKKDTSKGEVNDKD